MQVLDTTTGEVFDDVIEAAEQTDNEVIAVKSCCDRYHMTHVQKPHFIYLEDYTT